MTPGEAQKLVDAAVATLIEHFDAVQIFATWCEDGGTERVQSGAGNWYARTGLATEFLSEETARVQSSSIVAEEDAHDEFD